MVHVSPKKTCGKVCFKHDQFCVFGKTFYSRVACVYYEMLRHVNRCHDIFYNREVFRSAQQWFLKAGNLFKGLTPFLEKEKKLNEQTRQTEVKLLLLANKNYFDN